MEEQVKGVEVESGSCLGNRKRCSLAAGLRIEVAGEMRGANLAYCGQELGLHPKKIWKPSKGFKHDMR